MLESIAGADAARAAATPTASALGSLDPDAFMQLLVAQLRYQDPLQPSDPAAMMQQTSVLAQTEMIQRLAQVQQQVLGLTQAAIAADLVGKNVTAELQDGSTVSGTVDAVRFTALGPTLQIGDAEVPLEAASVIA